MSQELYEKCREIKETSNPRITNQDLADATGKSERTVAQFLRGEIPNASCETVASICKELGVSVDEHYGITMPEPNPDEQLTKEIRTLESENHVLKIQNVELAGEVENLKLEVSHQKEKADFLRAQLKTQPPCDLYPNVLLRRNGLCIADLPRSGLPRLRCRFYHKWKPATCGMDRVMHDRCRSCHHRMVDHP